jgi:hypothetical protein
MHATATHGVKNKAQHRGERVYSDFTTGNRYGGAVSGMNGLAIRERNRKARRLTAIGIRSYAATVRVS